MRLKLGRCELDGAIGPLPNVDSVSVFVPGSTYKAVDVAQVSFAARQPETCLAYASFCDRTQGVPPTGQSCIA